MQESSVKTRDGFEIGAKTALRFFITVVSTIFVAEVIIMLFLAVIPPTSPKIIALFDALMLGVISFPVLYFLSFQPLVRQIAIRRAAEERLGKANEFNEGLIRTIPLGIDILDKQGRILYINNTLKQMLGEDAIGRLCASVYRDSGEPCEDCPLKQDIEPGETYSTEVNNALGGRVFLVSYTGMLYEQDKAVLRVIDDITERKLAEKDLRESEDALRKSLNEKDVLLREIHHRVKNNMQVIASLLSLQSRRIADKKTRALFMESQNRVKAIVLVQELLYQSQSLAEIDLKRYISKLAESIFRAYPVSEKVSCETDLDAATLSIDQATPFGLVINELLSNALKYAFPEGASDRIRVSLRSMNNGQLELVISDNGIGISKEIDIEHTQTLGLSLVRGLVEDQLRGSLEVSQQKGTCFTVRFRQQRYKKRI